MLTRIAILLIGSLSLLHCRRDNPSPSSSPRLVIRHESLQLDTLGGAQDINLLRIPRTMVGQTLTFDLAYEDSLLLPTSTFAQRARAIAAINAGFFNMERGGSVTYLERLDTLVAGPLSDSLHRIQLNPHFNAAVVIDSLGQLQLDTARTPQHYLKSQAENAVLLTGPMLLLDSVALPLLTEKSFVSKAHPRSCLCSTAEDYLLITVDGRRVGATGMSLPSLQQFLLGLGCDDALNLDGGGSTTLWFQDSLLNRPSDKTGERPVANALLLLEQR
jgi:exopolysaccharide biosynthesis protein